jgi:uncharacterized DUF497 family protein
MKYEWDDSKNKKNKEKHDIGFEEATGVFDDDSSLEFDATKNGEYRIVRIGKTATKYILFVVYTFRGVFVRLISARQASKSERNLYIERKLKDQDDENANS